MLITIPTGDVLWWTTSVALAQDAMRLPAGSDAEWHRRQAEAHRASAVAAEQIMASLPDGLDILARSASFWHLNQAQVEDQRAALASETTFSTEGRAA